MSVTSGAVDVSSSTTPEVVYSSGLSASTQLTLQASGGGGYPVHLGGSTMTQNESIQLAPGSTVSLSLLLPIGDSLYALKDSSATSDVTVHYLAVT